MIPVILKKAKRVAELSRAFTNVGVLDLVVVLKLGWLGKGAAAQVAWELEPLDVGGQHVLAQRGVRLHDFVANLARVSSLVQLGEGASVFFGGVRPGRRTRPPSLGGRGHFGGSMHCGDVLLQRHHVDELFLARVARIEDDAVVRVQMDVQIILANKFPVAHLTLEHLGAVLGIKVVVELAARGRQRCRCRGHLLFGKVVFRDVLSVSFVHVHPQVVGAGEALVADRAPNFLLTSRIGCRT